jgi:hypothetical protein
MFAQQFGGRSLFAEPSLSRSQRVRVDLVEVFGVRCPYWVGSECGVGGWRGPQRMNGMHSLQSCP